MVTENSLNVLEFHKNKQVKQIHLVQTSIMQSNTNKNFDNEQWIQENQQVQKQ